MINKVKQSRSDDTRIYLTGLLWGDNIYDAMQRSRGGVSPSISQPESSIYLIFQYVIYLWV